MTKIITFSIIAVILIACFSSCDHDIRNLHQRTLSFNQLPIRVQKKLDSIPKCEPGYRQLLVVNDIDTAAFKVANIPVPFGPKSWISHIELKDLEHHMVYKLAQGTPDPLIIYEHKLYIPSEYNILCSEDHRKVAYTEYKLK